MTKYRKKPLIVDAFQLITGAIMPEWMLEAFRNNTAYIEPDRKLQIITNEGVMTASTGDWIIKGVAGELYPCKPDIFAATYEAVND